MFGKGDNSPIIDGKTSINSEYSLCAVDHSARGSMKNAANCEK